jgi:CD109 antigen
VLTGCAPVAATIAEAVARDKRIKRYDIAGRKVIFYVENMKPGDRVSIRFQVKALYPVKAEGVTSRAYSYYQPEMRGETLGKDVTVR